MPAVFGRLDRLGITPGDADAVDAVGDEHLHQFTQELGQMSGFHLQDQHIPADLRGLGVVAASEVRQDGAQK